MLRVLILLTLMSLPVFNAFAAREVAIEGTSTIFEALDADGNLTGTGHFTIKGDPAQRFYDLGIASTPGAQDGDVSVVYGAFVCMRNVYRLVWGNAVEYSCTQPFPATLEQ